MKNPLICTDVVSKIALAAPSLLKIAISDDNLWVIITVLVLN